MTERSEIYINGKWVESAATDSIDVVNPYTEQVVGTVPRGTAADVDRAARAAADAFPAWSAVARDERIALFDRMIDALEDRSEDVTRTIVEELGQPATVVSAMQTAGGIEDMRVARDAISQIEWQERIDHILIRKLPAGVVGAITAWNGPLQAIAVKAGAAMAAGCTVVLKGSELAPGLSFIFAEAAEAAGFPDGVLNLVSGTGPEVGEPIAEHPLVDMVSITGSIPAGKRVMQLASKTVKRVVLELGGKSVNLVLPDADLEAALADGIDDAFRISGQACGALSRVLVPRSSLADAESIMAAKASSYVMGDPWDERTTLGPLVSDRQRTRVRGYIQSAIDEDLPLLTGGLDVPQELDRGYFVAPTVFVGDNDARIAREEIFGPVLIVIPYEDEADALAIANDSTYGLASGVWAGDAEHARAVGAKLRVGRVRINGTPMSKRAPHGGFKLSGVGREWGRRGVEEFLDTQSMLG